MLGFLKQKKNLWTLLVTAVGSLAFIAAALLVPVNRFYAGLVLILCGIAAYFVTVFFITDDRNWLDIRAVFSGVWLVTIGLAPFGLLDYQTRWKFSTWIFLGIAFLIYQIGSNLGIRFGLKQYEKIADKLKTFKIGRIGFEFKENRLFYICVTATGIGLICFLIGVAINGYIPCFHSSTSAYVDFYTKFHVFSVAATGVSGLCYYCIRTQKLSLAKKIILYVCIFYLVFLFPILVVSRGTFITAALSLVVAAFYLHGKKLIALVLSIVVVFGVYLFTTTLRNYTDAQLEVFFEPSEIVIDPSGGEDGEGVGGTTFSLPPKVAFVYSYLTVSHDNFNQAVEKIENHTFGARQMRPFNVIIRSEALTRADEDAPYYYVREHLNTVSLVGDAYYDFGIIGVIVTTLLMSFAFGIIQALYEKKKTPFALMTLGNAMVPVAMCFFTSWLSNFTQWMLWGVAFLALIISTVKILPKKEKVN